MITLGLFLPSLGSSIYNQYLWNRFEEEKLVIFRPWVEDGYPHIPHDPNNDIDTIEDFVRKSEEKIIRIKDPGLIAKTITELVSLQYKHRHLEYRCSYNWIGCLFSKTKIPKLNEALYVIRPRHIAKAQHSFCSQQAIIIQSILKGLNINYATIRVVWDDVNLVRRGHFFTIAFIGGGSYLMDSDLMPNITWSGNFANNLLTESKTETTFKAMYSKIINESDLPNNTYITASINNFNSYPASKGLMMQRIIEHSSWYGWIYLLIILLSQRIQINLFKRK